MGFLRGAVVTVLAVILLIALFIMNATWTLTWSLEYDTLKPVLKETVMNYAEEQFQLQDYIDEATSLMQEYCKNNTEFVFNQDGQTFVISCENVNQGSEAILDQGLDTLMENVYYFEYDCEFWQCVKSSDNFLVLISEKAYDYWKSKFLIFILISVALFILIFLVSNRKSNAFILSGIVTIISSLPFMKLTWIAIFIPEEFRSIFLSFFARSQNVFLIMLIIGFVLLGLGITFHFLRWGLKISKIFKKDADENELQEKVSEQDIKDIVKKEISKNKLSDKNSKKISSKPLHSIKSNKK